MTVPVTIKLADYAPDASEYNPAVTDYLRNVIPVGDGYGPFPGWAAFGTALAARCRGAITVRKLDGSTAMFAGTATNLYRFSSASNSWVSVTRLSGGSYAVPDATDWCFTLFGNKLIATNGYDDNQYIDIDSGNNFAALSNSPKAFYCCTAGDFLILGRLTANQKGFAWSGINDTTYWTYGYKGSDEQTLADGGLIRGLVAIGNDIVLLQDDGSQVAERVGGNFVFKVSRVTQNIGCYAPSSIVAVRDTFFWWGPGGFYEGINANPIGFEKVDATVRELADAEKLREMRGSYDPDRNLVWWIIKKTDGSAFLIGYNWALKKWAYVEIDIDFMFPAISPGYTIGDLATLGYTMNELPYPFDSAFWTGNGIRTLAGFTTAGAFGWFQATPPAARVETIDMSFAEGETAFVNRFRAITDAPYTAISGAVSVRRYPGKASVWKASVAATEQTGHIWTRARGNTHRFRLDIAPSDWGNISSLQAWVRKAGKR